MSSPSFPPSEREVLSAFMPELASGLPVFARALGMISLLPLGEGSEGHMRRLALAGAMALGLSPEVESTGGDTLGALLIEFSIGLVIGAPFIVMIEVAEMWGELLDAMRGESISAAFDPTVDRAVSTTGTLSRTVMWGVLMHAGLLVAIVEVFRGSYSGPHLDEALIGTVMRTILRGVIYGAMVALPWGVVMLSVDILGGLLGKIVPSWCLSSEVFLVKTWLTVLLCVGVLHTGALSADSLIAWGRSVLGY